MEFVTFQFYLYWLQRYEFSPDSGKHCIYVQILDLYQILFCPKFPLFTDIGHATICSSANNFVV